MFCWQSYIYLPQSKLSYKALVAKIFKELMTEFLKYMQLHNYGYLKILQLCNEILANYVYGYSIIG